VRRSADAAPAYGADADSVQGWVFRRGAIAVAVLLASVVLASPAFPAAGVGSRSSLATLRAGVLVKLNQIRRAHGLVPLTLNPELSAAAAQHTNEMLVDGYFAHNSADGSVFWKRIQHYYPSDQYQSWSVGENLLWSAGSLNATRALDLWMKSPEHRTNILTARWREIGIAAQIKQNAPGAFGGYSVTVVATDFGARS
jgi:uncharacterized protein YkwD